MVDHVPEADGRSRARIICSSRPHAEARNKQPTLEDGYLLLVGEQVGEEAA